MWTRRKRQARKRNGPKKYRELSIKNQTPSSKFLNLHLASIVSFAFLFFTLSSCALFKTKEFAFDYKNDLKKISLEGAGIGKLVSADGSASFSFDMTWDREKKTLTTLMDFLLLGEGLLLIDYKNSRTTKVTLDGLFKSESVKGNSQMIKRELTQFASFFARFLEYYEHYLLAEASTRRGENLSIPWIWTGTELEFMIIRSQRKLKISFSDYDLEKFRGLKLECFVGEESLFSLYFKF